MKIFDEQNDRILDSITIYLTPSEAHQLGDFAKQLSLHPEDHHAHVDNLDSSVEITIAVYTPENINQFDVKSRAILQNEIKGI